MQRCGITILICGLLTAGCASDQPAVDVTAFDGDYITSYRHSPATQVVDGVPLDCAPVTEALFVRVRNGVASGYLHRDENYSFRTTVSHAGHLKTTIPIDSHYRYDADNPMPVSSLLLIFEAQLDQTASGAITVGDRRFNFDGCTTGVEIIAL